ncbi:MAG TPA: hydrogenase iron-sulfur subunit [Anaerolineae bacterium]|nr:hydrogenase iron-sulfur subunit [Anaerolineae bacterium]
MAETRAVGFLCNWCSYVGADLAGTSRLPVPANISFVRVPCSGRVDPLMVVRAFQGGADGVLVLGCHPGDCHYRDGNYYARRRFALMHRFLEFLGIEPERFRLDWVSAAEGDRFSRITREFTDAVERLGPLELPWARGAKWVGEATGQRVVSTGQRMTESPSLLATQSALRETARRLLAEDRVDVFIGYEMGPRGATRPAFLYEPEEAERLVWNTACTHNLTRYLRDKSRPARRGEPPPRIGLVVKACDARSLNLLLHDDQIERERITVVGVVCDGMRQGAGFPADRLSDEMQSRCQDCTERVPVLYDELIGEPQSVEGVSGLDEVAALEALPVAERRAFWAAEFDRCLLCYACRQACPLCYCAECLAEQLGPPWEDIAIRRPEKAFFHIMRAYHLAGRCVGCNECARACPMGIRLDLLNLKIAKEAEALFGYRAGEAVDALPVLATFKVEEGVLTR